MSLQWQAMLPVLVLDECFVHNTQSSTANNDTTSTTSASTLDALYPDRTSTHVVSLTYSPLRNNNQPPQSTIPPTTASTAAVTQQDSDATKQQESQPGTGTSLQGTNSHHSHLSRSGKGTKHSWREGGERQLRYRTFLDSFCEDFQAGPASSVDRRASHGIDSLYAHHRHLQAVFRFFDRDGSGVITSEKFKHSCELLNASLPPSGV